MRQAGRSRSCGRQRSSARPSEERRSQAHAPRELIEGLSRVGHGRQHRIYRARAHERVAAVDSGRDPVEARRVERVHDLVAGAKRVDRGRKLGDRCRVALAEDEQQLAARTQHAPELAQPRAELGPEVERVDAEGLVEGRIRVGDAGGVALVHAHAAGRDLAAQMAPRDGQHHLRRIDARREPVPEAIHHPPERSAVAAAELEDVLAELRIEALDGTPVHGGGVERHHTGHDVAEEAARVGGLTGDELRLRHRFFSPVAATSRSPAQYVRQAPSTVAAKPSVSSFQPAMQLRGITIP